MFSFLHLQILVGSLSTFPALIPHTKNQSPSEVGLSGSQAWCHWPHLEVGPQTCRGQVALSTESGGADDSLSLQMRFLLLAWDGGAQFEKHQLRGSIPEFLA